MKKFAKLGFCIILLGSVLIPLLGFVLGFRSPSLEKSTPPPFPLLIKAGRFNTDYSTEFDAYFKKTLPFRPSMIAAFHRINEVLFHQSGSSKVFLGKDGYLFFEETLNDYLKVDTLSINDLLRLNQVLRIQNEYLSRLGIDSHFMVAPNKATVYGEKMPSTLKVIGTYSNLDRISTMDLAMDFIDIKKPLIDIKAISSRNLYHLKDTHWNNLGAAVGYEALMDALGVESLRLLDQAPVLSSDWQGDLATMLDPSKITYDEQYHFVLPEKFTFTRAIRSFEDLEIESVTATKEESLWMFRDSFANALIPFLSESFGHVDYSRVFPYDYRKIQIASPHHILIEIAERNLNWLLQSTPILLSDPLKTNTIATDEIKLAYTLTQQTANGYFFLNARYTDQATGAIITAVKIVNQQGEVDVFPVYQDGNFEDDQIEYGFSVYTKTVLDMTNSHLLVQIDGKWHNVR